MHHLDEVKKFISSPKPLLLLLGDAGAGKTELLDRLEDERLLVDHHIRFNGRDHIKPQSLIQRLSQVWHCDIIDETASLQDQLQELVTTLTRQSKSYFLLIDDAHLLPYSVLAALVHICLSHNEHQRLHLILSGRVSLLDKVQVLTDQPFETIRLGVVRQNDVRQRVRHFLQQTHIKSDEDLIDNITQRIYEQTQGNAEKIDQSLRSLTLHDFMSSKPISSEPKTKTKKRRFMIPFNHEAIFGEQGARAFAVVGLIGVVFGLYWYEHHPQSVSPPLPSKPYSYALTKPITLPKAKPLTFSSTAPSDYYTIQLMGSFKQNEIKDYLAAHHYSQPTQIISEQFHGKPWFVLGLGHYSSSQKAAAALKALPLSQSHQGAWIKHVHPSRS